MENLVFAFNCIAPLFIIVFFGYFLKKGHVIDQHFVDVASNFSFKYLFPLVMFRQIYNIDLHSDLRPNFIIYGVVSYALFGVLVWLIVPRCIKENPIRGAFMQGIYRSNCLLMGVVLAGNVFGPDGSLPTVMLLPFVAVVQNIGAVLFLTVYSPEQHKLSIRKMFVDILKNPIIIGAFAGLLFAAFRIPVPTFLVSPINDLAGIATTLALVCMGGQIEFKNLFTNLRLIFAGCFIRLFLCPFLLLTPAIIFFDFSGYEIGAYYFIFGACTAVSSFVMSKAMKADETVTTQMVVFTTVFSSVSMLIWIFFLRQFGII